MKGPAVQKHSTAALVLCSVLLPASLGGLFAVNDSYWNLEFIAAAEDFAKGLVVGLVLILLWMSVRIYDISGPPSLLTDVGLRPGVVCSGLAAGVFLWTMALPQLTKLSYVVVEVMGVS